MILLIDADEQLRKLVRAGDEDAAVELFLKVVFERICIMHQRAQAAESRACKAERDFERLVRT